MNWFRKFCKCDDKPKLYDVWITETHVTTTRTSCPGIGATYFSSEEVITSVPRSILLKTTKYMVLLNDNKIYRECFFPNQTEAKWIAEENLTFPYAA